MHGRSIATSTSAICLVAAVLLPLSQATWGAPASTVTPDNFFPISFTSKHLTAHAQGANSPADRIGVEVSGVVPLRLLLTQDRHNTPVALTSEKIVYVVDGVPVSGVLSAPYTFNWNSAGVADGAHTLSVILVDGPSDLASYRIEPSVVVVGNGSGSRTAAQRMPVLGGNLQSYRVNSATPDWVMYPGGTMPPHPMAHPLAVKTIPPAHTLSDPSQALVPNGWVVEPITQGITGLYQTRPRWFQTRNGYVIAKPVNTQEGSEAEAVTPQVPKHAHFDGPRNDNSVSLYSTIVPEPGGPTWLGVDLAGRLFRLHADGSVVTLAGDVTRRDVLPLDFSDDSVSAAARRSVQVETKGSFDGGLQLSMPMDVAIDPRNHNIVYVADPGNRRIARVDLASNPVKITTYAGKPGVAGTQDGARASATFMEPWSLVMTADGTLYVADRAANAIRSISADGSVSTVVNGTAGILQPFVIRLDSHGRIVLGENKTSSVKRINPITKAVEVITTAGCSSEWIWLDVDRRGNVGPKDDVLLVCATGGGGNTDLKRISADGTRNSRVLDGSGSANMGNLAVVQEAHGHYPWVIAIDDQEARILAGGFGNSGLHMLRMRHASEPVPRTLDGFIQGVYAAGAEIYRRGTVKGFPFGARPSFTALRTESGHGYLGLENFDDLEPMSDAELADYIRSGMGGSVPRPEITGKDMRALVFFIRHNMLSSVGALPKATSLPTDVTAPVISDVRVIPVDATTARVEWTTNEPTLGFVAFGPSAAYHRWSELEPGYATSHSAKINFLPAGKPIHFAVRTKDEAGNQTLTADQTFTTTGNAATPAPTLAFSATPSSVAAGGTAVLSWFTSDATACTASGGWSQPVGLSGTVTTPGLLATNTFRLTCTGSGGQVARDVTVAVGSVSATPTLTITSPAPGARLTVSTIAVHYAVGGNQTGVAKIALQLDAAAPVLTESESYMFENVSDGAHTVRVWLTSTDGSMIAGTEKALQIAVNTVAAPADEGGSEPAGGTTEEDGSAGGCTVSRRASVDAALPLLVAAALAVMIRRRLRTRRCRGSVV